MPPRLPDQTTVGPVALNVRDLDALLAFYRDIAGLQVREHSAERAVLGTQERALLTLLRVPAARRMPRTTGLYHVALLLPSRRDLAQALTRLMAQRYPLQGAADHLVSEALYLADPEGNGIELYRDRPRDRWPMQGAQVQMATEPLDLNALLAEASEDAGPALPDATRIGHVHLHVHDIGEAEAFYVEVLGFQRMQRYGRQASFLAAGGYHHHVGINTWGTAGAPAPPPGSLGLHHFTLVLPGEAERTEVTGRLQAAGYALTITPEGPQVTDPAGNALALTVTS
jgi:catechol 2,3-dioxygenase